MRCKVLIARRLAEVGASIRQTFEPVIMTHLYQRSEIFINVQVVSADGGEFIITYKG
jgi:exosome complex component RRP41